MINDINNISDIKMGLRQAGATFRKGQVVRHFKGQDYLFLGIVTHSETKEFLVLYKALYGNYGVYVRPAEMFFSRVDKEKYPDVEQEWRFQFLDEF